MLLLKRRERRTEARDERIKEMRLHMDSNCNLSPENNIWSPISNALFQLSFIEC